MGKVYIVGTCDTKGAELSYAREVVLSAGTEAVLVDVGTLGEGTGADVQARDVAAFHPAVSYTHLTLPTILRV